MEKYRHISPDERKELFDSLISEAFGEEVNSKVIAPNASLYIVKIVEMIRPSWARFIDVEERIHNLLHPYTFSSMNRVSGSLPERRWFINVAPGKRLFKRLGSPRL